jgi:hypothetical protein
LSKRLHETSCGLEPVTQSNSGRGEQQHNAALRLRVRRLTCSRLVE